MPVDAKLLEILCCPVSRTPLARVTPQQLETLNRAVTEGRLKYVGGEPVEQALEEALVTEDHKVVYPVEDGIPILLAERGIGTTQLDRF